MTHSAESWIERFAEALDTDPPTEDEMSFLLELAGVAAHASERTAAPVSCWLAARAGVAPLDALALGKRLATQLEGDGE
jgi:hypothetical protein